MHRSCRFLLLLAGLILGLARAASADEILQHFDGQTSLTTVDFTVPDGWEVRWNSQQILSIGIIMQDGRVVAGSTGMQMGSLYLAKGGSYRIRVKTQLPTSWDVQVVAAVAPANPSGPFSIYFAPEGPLSNLPIDATPAAVPPIAPESAAGMVPSSATNAAAAAPPAATPEHLTEEQARAVVLIKGDNAQGTGFLVKMADGPCVITNIHVLSANPHIKIITSAGETIAPGNLKGATDRDLAMISIQDNGYSYLQLNTDPTHTVQTGDTVLTPGNSEGGEVMLNTTGTVLALGPQRVEINNPIYHGNSGGPIFHPKSGKVIGVVTEALKVNKEDALDKASFSNQKSAISGDMRYFGLRVDNVPTWEPYTWDRFYNETQFLENFHMDSRYLNSYLNGNEKDADSDYNLYTQDEKLNSADDQFRRDIVGADVNQRILAFRHLLFTIDSLADTDMDAIKVPANFYTFNQKRAHDEMEFRAALRRQMDEYGDSVDSFASRAHKAN